MNITNIILGAVVIAALFGAGFGSGAMYEKSGIQKAQVAVLQHDDKQLPKIEVADHAREKIIIRTVEVAAKTLPPGDCFNAGITPADVDSLHTGGVTAKP